MPDLVFTNPYMPEISGIEATYIIKQKFPLISVIAFYPYDKSNLQAILKSGADGCLLKDTTTEQIILAAKKVLNHEMYYSPDTSCWLLKLWSKIPSLKEKSIKITQQELKIIELICQQDCNKEIAFKLKLTVKAVERTRERLQIKLGAKYMLGIVEYAVKNGIVNW